MKHLNLVVWGVLVFLMIGCQSTEYINNSKINQQPKVTTNNWIIYENRGENYIVLNIKTNEQVTDVYDERGQKFLSAQEAVDALNNK